MRPAAKHLARTFAEVVPNKQFTPHLYPDLRLPKPASMTENVNKAKKGRPANQAPQWRVQALSVPSPDSDLALYVAFDNVRYLFGAGEGVQRTFVQRKVSLKGVEGVFVSGGDGEGKRVGGLAGEFVGITCLS